MGTLAISTIAIAAILAFLFLLWRDSMSRKDTHPAAYLIRAFLIGAVTVGIATHPSLANAGSGERALVWMAIGLGVVTTIVFVLRAAGRFRGRRVEDEPLPSIFGPEGPPDRTKQKPR
ncbi:MAG: hypothetical protein KY459_14475 [Acidobacteria bacterium]|nr:hypothetical protein [Acidobacteriota bacterium]